MEPVEISIYSVIQRLNLLVEIDLMLDDFLLDWS